MERKSGFKECPRCGLRNKPSAAQCDFCGWEFQDVSDEWISHVQVLEKLNRETDSILLDDEVSKRIESTIVRSPRESTPAPRPEPRAPPSAPLPVPLPAKEDVIQADLRQQGMDRPQAKPVAAALPAKEADEVKAFVDTMIGEPAAAEAAAVVTVQSGELAAARVAPSIELGSPVETRKRTASMSKYTMGLLGAGAAVYLVTLVLYSMAMLSVAMGWALAIAGALMITVGASFIYDARVARQAKPEPVIGQNVRGGDEVIICPRCHEEVDESDDRCPSCGAAFTR